jgi:hypothetical protein
MTMVEMGVTLMSVFFGSGAGSGGVDGSGRVAGLESGQYLTVCPFFLQQ